MRLHSIIGFENTGRVWFDIDTRQKFCLYVAEPGHPQEAFGAAFNVNSLAKALALKKGLPFSIPISLVEEFSPEALAVSEVAHASEVEVARKIYATFPKFGSGWDDPDFRPYAAELHMGNDRGAFDSSVESVPVYEGRMVDSFDYRAKAYVSGRGRAAVWRSMPFGSKDKAIVPQWRIAQQKIPNKSRGYWQRYRIGLCSIASPTNQRAFVSCLIPPNVICGHGVLTIRVESNEQEALLLWLAVANSFVIDFIVRKKVSLNITLSLVDSLPLPKLYSGGPVEAEIVRRSLMLAVVGPEMERFWNDLVGRLGLDGTVHPLEIQSERDVVSAELDVLVARDLFGLSKNELKYILDPELVLGDGCGIETFGALRRAEIREFGTFATANRILKIWDTLPAWGQRSVDAAQIATN